MPFKPWKSESFVSFPGKIECIYEGLIKINLTKKIVTIFVST